MGAKEKGDWRRWTAWGLLMGIALTGIAFLSVRFVPGGDIDFLDYEVRASGQVFVLFRLRNTGRLDYHYRIWTQPPLDRESAVGEMGLLAAGTFVTNRIPIQVLDQSFKLVVNCYPLPVLPRSWYRDPALAWQCLRAYGRRQSRLLINYPRELSTNWVVHRQTPMLSPYRPSAR